jgi:hypothetical protein
MPAGAKFPQPNQLECIFEHPNFAELGGPGFFLPWDNNLYLCVRGNFRDDMTSSASVFQKVAKRQKEEYDLAQKQRADEFAYRRKHLEARIAATLETLTERDFREYVAKQKAGRPKTPRVFLGGI